MRGKFNLYQSTRTFFNDKTLITFIKWSSIIEPTFYLSLGLCPLMSYPDLSNRSAMATLSALFLLSTVVGVLGFPNGPPLAQCPGMIPAGHGPSNAVGPPPYNITTSALNYSVGSTLDG